MKTTPQTNKPETEQPAAPALRAEPIEPLQVPLEALRNALSQPEPEPQEPPAEPKAADETHDKETQEVWRYNAATDDYQLVRVSVNEPVAPRLDDPDSFHDDFELGPAYYEGRLAEFDYRWCHENAKHNLTDRKNGFVPVRDALNTRFRLQNGAVSNGDLVLMRRPKEISEERALVQQSLHDRLSGEIDGFSEAVNRLNPRGERAVSAIGAINDTDQAENAPPKGRRSYAINAPFQKDRLNIMSPPPARNRQSESLGAVGG